MPLANRGARKCEPARRCVLLACLRASQRLAGSFRGHKVSQGVPERNRAFQGATGCARQDPGVSNFTQAPEGAQMCERACRLKGLEGDG